MKHLLLFSSGWLALMVLRRLPAEVALNATAVSERASDPTLLQTIYTRNDPEMLARIESAREGAPAWIQELRTPFPAAQEGDAGMGSNHEKIATMETRFIANEPKSETGRDGALRRPRAVQARAGLEFRVYAVCAACDD